MSFTKVKNNNLYDPDLVTLAEKGVGTGADQIVQRDGSGDIAGLVKTSDIGTNVQAFDANIATTSDITTAVSDLVNSAPGTLNTLNELAAALGDDENHATAMTTLINAKLSPNGDGSLLTNLPAGKIDITASGALSNGDLVVLQADGTVKVVSETTTEISQQLGASATSLASSLSDIASGFDPISNKVVIAYRDSAANGNIGRSVVGTVSGTSISFGSPVTFNSGSSAHQSISFDSNSNKVIVAYRDIPAGNAKAIVGTVSGTSISFGTAETFQDAINISATFDSNANRVVIAYRDQAGNAGKAIVGTVSGTSISFGSSVSVGVTIEDISATFDSNSNKVVLAYKNLASTLGQAIVGTVTGTVITLGTAVTFNSAGVEDVSATFDSISNKVVIAYRDGGNLNHGTAIVGTVSGTSISFGTEVVFNSGDSDNISAIFDSNANRVIIAYRDIDNIEKGTFIVGTVSGTSISFATEVVFESGDSRFIATSFDSNSNKVVVAYRDDGNSDQGTVIVFSPAYNFLSSNLLTNNFIGISDGVYTDTSTATIQIVGATDDAQAGLTIGTQYVQGDGTLSSTPDATYGTVYAGLALSATELLIKA